MQPNTFTSRSESSANWSRLRGGSQLPFARDERHQSELVRLFAKIGAQVGTVMAIQFVFFTRSGGLSTKVGLEPRYLSTSNRSVCEISR